MQDWCVAKGAVSSEESLLSNLKLPFAAANCTHIKDDQNLVQFMGHNVRGISFDYHNYLSRYRDKSFRHEAHRDLSDAYSKHKPRTRVSDLGSSGSFTSSRGEMNSLHFSEAASRHVSASHIKENYFRIPQNKRLSQSWRRQSHLQRACSLHLFLTIESGLVSIPITGSFGSK